MQLWHAFLIAFTALLPLINPIGSALVLLGLVGEAPPAVYRTLARKVALNNIAFLAIIELLGSAILNFFGISLPIVQVSGGIVIASIGWSVLNDKASDATRDKPEAATLDPEQTLRSFQQKAFYPFTFPVTSGPGTLVVVLTLSARFSMGAPVTVNVLDHLGLFLAILVLSGLVYLCYAYAPRVRTAVAPSTVNGILRIVAFLLICIGIQIAWNGLRVLLGSLLHSA